MKVGIIAFNNIKFSPYIYYYTSILEELNYSYELIYLNREMQPDKVNFPTKYLTASTSKAYEKISAFLKYYIFLKRTIKKEEYDFIIVLTSIPAVMLNGFLKKNYKKKYIVDVRDFTYENYKIYKFFLNKSLNFSKLNVISSRDFINFLPPNDYVLCHNINRGYYPIEKIKKNTTSKIKIGYIGSISYINYCLKFLTLVGNDPRFEFHFHGKGIYDAEIIDYISKNQFKNIFFHGEYKPEEKYKIYSKIDIIYNVYGNDSNLVKYAISNKYYDSLIFKKPILISLETSMESMTGSLGYTIDLNRNNEITNIFNWYIKIDESSFNSIATEMLAKVKEDNINFSNKVKKALT